MKKNGAKTDADLLKESTSLSAGPITVPVVRAPDPPLSLDAMLDKRVKDMLGMCVEAKDLIAAVNAATKYLAVKNKLSPDEEPGSGF